MLESRRAPTSKASNWVLAGTGSRQASSKGQVLQQPGEAAGALFQALGWGPAGGGEVVCPRNPLRSPPRGPGHPSVGALGLCGVLGVSMETQRNSGKVTTEVGGFSGRALCPLSDPSPTARPVGSCSPKAAAARGAEDAERRLSPPSPNLLERGGGH